MHEWNSILDSKLNGTAKDDEMTPIRFCNFFPSFYRFFPTYQISMIQKSTETFVYCNIHSIHINFALMNLNITRKFSTCHTMLQHALGLIWNGIRNKYNDNGINLWWQKKRGEKKDSIAPEWIDDDDYIILHCFNFSGFTFEIHQEINCWSKKKSNILVNCQSHMHVVRETPPRRYINK